MTYTIDIAINDFHGAAIMNIQPVLMELLTNRPEWEAVIRDKTIRYYHLIRPKLPNRETPKLNLKRKRSISRVRNRTEHDEKYYGLIRIGLVQWSYARCIEHISDLLRASAIIDNRMLVQEEDYDCVLELLAPIQLERYLLRKYAFESAIHFEDDAMCIMTEMASFDPLSIETVCQDFKMTVPTAKRILSNLQQWCTVEPGEQGLIKPTEFAKGILEMIK